MSTAAAPARKESAAMRDAEENAAVARIAKMAGRLRKWEGFIERGDERFAVWQAMGGGRWVYGKNGKSALISAGVGWRPYSQISKASANFTAAPFSGPYHLMSDSRKRSASPLW